jgi:hypothetical protein
MLAAVGSTEAARGSLGVPVRLLELVERDEISAPFTAAGVSVVSITAVVMIVLQWAWVEALRRNPARRRDRGSEGKAGRGGGGPPGLRNRISVVT